MVLTNSGHILNASAGKFKRVVLNNRKCIQAMNSNPSPTGAAGDSGGKCQGHCMKHEAVTCALVKWLLSLTDEVAARDFLKKTPSAII